MNINPTGSRYSHEVLQGDKKEEDRTARVKVMASFSRAEKDFAKMNISVDKWQIAEEEQAVRRNLGSFVKWFCPRINTITPLIAASESVKEMHLSREDLIEKMRVHENADNRGIPRDFLTFTGDRFQFRRYEVVKGLDRKLDQEIQATWSGWPIKQWWSNKDEAVVWGSVKSALVVEGQQWNSIYKFPPVNEVDNAELTRQKDIRDKAVWNVYSRVGVRMLVTAGAIAIPIVIVSTGSRR
ncbi:MAG: hypothetical protein V4489_10340 [Chlamydiota bacterium]